MRKHPFLTFLVACLAVLSTSAPAQLINTPTPDSQVLASTCPTVTGTISSSGGSVTMTCPLAGAYTIRLTTPSGQSDFSGSLTAQSANGSPKRWMRTGVAPLDVSVITFTGQTMGSRYYTISGGQALSVVASSYTSGQVIVSIAATPVALYPIINGETQTSSVVALLNGRSFTSTFPGGTLSVANGSYACLYIKNNSSEMRGIWETRAVSNDVTGGASPAKYIVINNPTGTVPTTAANIGARGAAGYTSVMSVSYGTLANLPSGSQAGGYVPTNGQAFVLPLEKTIEPLSSQILCVLGVNPSTAVGTTSNPAILYGWREQSVN